MNVRIAGRKLLSLSGERPRKANTAPEVSLFVRGASKPK
jgi:hypothetical protein